MCLGGVVFFCACGARTQLDAPRSRDAGGRDAAVPLRDGGLVAIDAEICGGDCDDGIFCNGEEICTTRGCQSIGMACDDGDICTEDRCDERTARCIYRSLELDGDGDGFRTCDGDCDDRNASIFPGAPEFCDGLNQDCDAQSDEGLISECGDCRLGCSVLHLPTEVGGTWEDIAEESEGVEVDSDGALRLSSGRTESTFAWIANTRYGTLTKLDLRTGAQTAEYDSVHLNGTNGAQMPGVECDAETQGNCPSRTAVDLRGAVYVANRAFEHQGTVTKIAGREEDCIDRNSNGQIETSRDVDGDGIIERSLAGEYLGQDDECILWTVDVGGQNGVPRAVAIDAEGFAWVGLYEEGLVLRLHPDTGRVVREISLRTQDFSPYGAAIASDGRLWIVEPFTGRIMSIDTRTGATGPVRIAESRAEGCRGSYGIAIDEDDRVWLAGLICPVAFRYDPFLNTWFEVSLPESGATRGIAADDRGYIYVGSSHEWIRFTPIGGIDASPPIARLTRFRADDGSELRVFGTEDTPLPGMGTVGVGLDADRNVWMINQDSGTATRFDPTSGEAREFRVGDTPYTYSDFTGFALRTFTAPNGFLRSVVEGCTVGPTEWEEIRWDAELPISTRLEIRVRAAPTRIGLQGALWMGPFRDQPVNLTTAPGPLPSDGRFLEIEVTLVSEDEATSPRLNTIDVQVHCPSEGGT